MTTPHADMFKGQSPTWTRHSHSVIEAIAQAQAAADDVATVIALPLPANQVKLIGRDLDDNVVFYTECPGADATQLLAILGVDSSDRDITELVQTFESDGIEFSEAVRVAALINASQRN